MGIASETFAALTRAQWANYVASFQPIENQLIEQATSPLTVTNAVQRAGANVDAAFDAQEGATARRLAGLGVTLTPEEQQAQQRATGLARSLADVQARNVARDLTVQRQRSVLGNPAPGVGATGVQ